MRIYIFPVLWLYRFYGEPIWLRLEQARQKCTGGAVNLKTPAPHNNAGPRFRPADQNSFDDHQDDSTVAAVKDGDASFFIYFGRPCWVRRRIASNGMGEVMRWPS